MSRSLDAICARRRRRSARAACSIRQPCKGLANAGSGSVCSVTRNEREIGTSIQMRIDQSLGSGMREELERIRDWAKTKIQGGSEPPWAWYQYMKLVET